MALWFFLLGGVIFVHKSSSAQCPVEICIKTEDVNFAGTDEDVYVRLFISNGRATPWIFMDEPKFDDFEKSSYKCYDVDILRKYTEEDKIAKVSVKLLGRQRLQSGWDVAYVTIKSNCLCRTYLIYTTLYANEGAADVEHPMLGRCKQGPE